MKNIIKIIKKIIFSFLLVIGFNMLYGTFKINIPLNMYTIAFITFMGFPGFCSIILIYYLI